MDKEKRKLAPVPLWKKFGRGIYRYGVVAPIQLVFSMLRGINNFSWQGVQLIFSGIGTIVGFSWRTTKFLVGGVWSIITAPFKWFFGLGYLPEFENERQRHAYIMMKRRFRRERFFRYHLLGTVLFTIFTVFFLFVAFMENWGATGLQNFWVLNMMMLSFLGLHYWQKQAVSNEEQQLVHLMNQDYSLPEKSKRHVLHEYYEEEYNQQPESHMTEEEYYRLMEENEINQRNYRE
jgi:hypothetical protein